MTHVIPPSSTSTGSASPVGSVYVPPATAWPITLRMVGYYELCI